jgi:hypothetical protein
VEKMKSLQGKNLVEPPCKTNLCEGEEMYASCFVTQSAYMIVCQVYKHKHLSKPRLMLWAAFQHDTIFYNLLNNLLLS